MNDFMDCMLRMDIFAGRTARILSFSTPGKPEKFDRFLAPGTLHSGDSWGLTSEIYPTS